MPMDSMAVVDKSFTKMYTLNVPADWQKKLQKYFGFKALLKCASVSATTHSLIVT